MENKKSKIKIILVLIFCVILGYVSFVFIPIPGIRDLRNLYIETAMTTAHHQYLAKYFIPSYIINKVMENRIATTSEISKPLNLSIKNEEEMLLDDKQKDNNFDKDILNLKSYNVGDLDSHGNKIIVNDLTNGIQIVKINGFGFRASLALIEDPGQVYVSYAKNVTYKGYIMQDYMNDTKAILGINASGFKDVNGMDTSGRTYAEYEEYGTYVENYNSFGFDKDNNFIVGHFDDWDERNIRDAIQFNPALVIDGKNQTIGKTGWGMQPRTCIGQTKDGVVLMLTIDGRSVQSLLGGSMRKAADILLEYGAVNAANCDGGSSTIMNYNGETINEVSFYLKEGRYLPNVFLVKTREQYLYSLAHPIERKTEVEIVEGEIYNVNLETLDLSNKIIKDPEQFKKDIRLFKKLKVLDLSNTNLTNWDCKLIRLQLKGKASVVWNVQIGEYNIKTDAKEFLVSQSKRKLDQIDAEFFQFCTDLETVDLSYQNITDVSFIPKYMPNVKELILTGNNIIDMSPLLELKNLIRLEVE